MQKIHPISFDDVKILRYNQPRYQGPLLLVPRPLERERERDPGKRW